MRTSTPSTPTPWSPRRRLVLAGGALGLHGIAIWWMWLSGVDVDRAPRDTRDAWLTIHPAAPPPRIAPAPPLPRPSPARRRAIVAPLPPVIAATPAEPTTSSASDGTAIAANQAPRASAPPLDLRLPPDAWKDGAPLTPAQDAMRDPRSNTLRLTLAERLLVDLGNAECIAWQRLPDGTIWRGPGHLRDVPGMPARPNGTRVQDCVR